MRYIFWFLIGCNISVGLIVAYIRIFHSKTYWPLVKQLIEWILE